MIPRRDEDIITVLLLAAIVTMVLIAVWRW